MLWSRLNISNLLKTYLIIGALGISKRVEYWCRGLSCKLRFLNDWLIFGLELARELWEHMVCLWLIFYY